MLLLFLFLVAGSLVEGFPVKKERYQTIRCRPDDNSIACNQEQPNFDQNQQSNKIDNYPVIKTSLSDPVPSAFSGEDNSSENGVYSGDEPGSATSYESNEINNYKMNYNFLEDNLIV